MHWQKISLIGVGLLGGSLGLAIRQRRLAGRVEGYVRRAASVAECQRLGVVDAATLDLRAAVTDADLIILCTPIGQMREVSARMAPSVRPGAPGPGPARPRAGSAEPGGSCPRGACGAGFVQRSSG